MSRNTPRHAVQRLHNLNSILNPASSDSPTVAIDRTRGARKDTMTDYKFFGWVGKDKNSIGNLVWEEYEPKTWTEDDVDIKITHCGICSSDLHTLRSGWGRTMYPQVVGHEIVGIAVKVGKNVRHVNAGDRVGVGAQSGSCLECQHCLRQEEQYCDTGPIGTYNGVYSDGSKSYGGYADYARHPGHFVVKIPDGLPSEFAAPMLCGGITVYSPLKEQGAGPGKKVGIVGIGGLGHFGILLAKAMGAQVVAISRSESKREDAIKMGASMFIDTNIGKSVFKKHVRTLDFISKPAFPNSYGLGLTPPVCTANEADMPLARYLSMLKVHGRFVMVGAPERSLPSIPSLVLLMHNISLCGSVIGSPADIAEMLDLAARDHVHGWVQTRPMNDTNQAVLDMEQGKARYRYCLVNEKNLAELSC